jgi:phospholipase/carboxylesterase
MNAHPLDETTLFQWGAWTARLRRGRGNADRLLLLLHGWTGDENSMWLFAPRLPADFTLLAPRAPHPEPRRGYTWRPVTPEAWGLPSLDDFRPAARELLGFVDDWSQQAGVLAGVFAVMGFSQGAALAYALAFLYPQRVERVIALAGFLPEGAAALVPARPLAGKAVYVAHGRRDEMIPVERARQAVSLLEQAGAQVTYCEAETGHKVSPDCLRGLDEFFGAHD